MALCRTVWQCLSLEIKDVIVKKIIFLLCLCSGHVFQSSCKNEPCCCNGLVIVRHVHMEGSNLDIAHKTNEIHKILNISLTMQLSSPGA